MQCSPFLEIFWDTLYLSLLKQNKTFKTFNTDKTFNIIITFCINVGVDNHNPVKTSNINMPGATSQIFCKVCVITEPKIDP